MEKEAIISLAFALGQHISESDELTNFKAKQAEVMQDSEAFRLLKEFDEARSAAIQKMESDEQLSEEEQQKLTQLENAMFANDNLSSLFSLQEKFNNMMTAVYYAIDQAVNGGSGCGGECGSCGSGCC